VDYYAQLSTLGKLFPNHPDGLSVVQESCRLHRRPKPCTEQQNCPAAQNFRKIFAKFDKDDKLPGNGHPLHQMPLQVFLIVVHSLIIVQDKITDSFDILFIEIEFVH
jgi:hypothetical protein